MVDRMRRLLPLALAVSAVGLAAPAVTSVPAGAAGGRAAVSVADGVLRWRVEFPQRVSRRDLVSARPCLTLTARSGATVVCVTSRARAKITRPDASTFVVPATVKRAAARSDWLVKIRQADLQLRPASAGLSASCTDGSCRPMTGSVELPPLRLTRCRAQGPWLVHAGDPDVGRAVALTFDDGPGPSTRAVMRVLRKARVLGTFFQLGRMITADPAILPTMAAAGHVIGNHSFTHPVLTASDAPELRRTTRAIEAAGVATPCLFRAPYGDNPTDVVRLARAQRMVTVHWNTDPGDWRGLTTNQIVATTLAQTRPGSILVFHDGEHHPATVAALPRIIDTLQQRGYRFLTVPELLRLPVHYS